MADDLQSNRAFPSVPQRSSLLSLPAYAESCERYRILWCLIEGDCKPFKVTTPLNFDINDLKGVIHANGINTTKFSVLPKDLVLWKLRESEPLEPNNTFARRVSTKISDLSEVATEPSPWKKLSVLFPQQPPQDCLHIIIQMPLDTGPRASDSNDWSSDMAVDEDALSPTSGVSLPTVPYTGTHVEPHPLLELNCLMSGETYSHIFKVRIEASQPVADLKDAIKEITKPALDHIPAYALDLWKVSIPVDGNFRVNAGILSGNPLLPVKKLSTVFPNPPVLEHIHIIVKEPAIAVGKGKRIITPPENTLGIKEIDQRIEEELKSLRAEVETFLKSPDPPTWVPPNYATQSDREFLASLRIPSYRNGNPSLLFHDLDVCDGDETKKIFGDGAQPLCICNTSGSGKTRRMLEGLTKYWGFYLVTVPDANGVGIRDLQDVLAEVIENRDWISDLSPLSSEKRTVQSELNSLIASKPLKKVLAARIVVFELFLELAIQVDGELQEKHKRIWLLFQLFDQLDSQGGTLHPFVRIIRHCLPHASAEALDILIGRLGTIRARYLPPSRFIVGLDEAQQAIRLYPRSFVSSTDNEVFRSILREIVKVFTKSPIKLVVSGTGLSLGDLEDSMASGVSKPANTTILFHELGMFETWPKLKAFLERYIPASFSETPSGYRLQQRIREYLLGRRYRFSVSFLEYLLMNGLQSPHKLLNEYIKAHTTCLPGDSGLDFTSNEPKLHIKVDVRGFEWERLKKDPAALQEAAQIVQSHLTRGYSPTFGPVTVRLVEYGIARLRNKHSGQIVEPLAFLSLMKWLERQPTVNLQTSIRLRLANQESRGPAYEQLVVLYLLRVLRYPVPLSTIFEFHGTPPRWADEMAQIVGRLDGTDVVVDVLGNAPENPGLGVVHYAAGIKDVLKWIENPTTMPAVLVPSHLFGPDVIVRCKDVLLMGQLKSYTEGNKDSLDAKTVSCAITSLCPDHWFKRSPPHLRQKLIHAIKRHRVLRFVGGYPLPPNINLGANSVSNALTALGSDVVLATINLDTFRAHFVIEDQARDVLGPMEDALARKREMDSGN
ncbi:hypothetical protein JOM56_006742 [Amanita muscaria]